MTDFDPVRGAVVTWGWVERNQVEVPNEAAIRMLNGGLTVEDATVLLDFLKHEVVPALLAGDTRLKLSGFDEDGARRDVAAFVGPDNVLDISMRGIKYDVPPVEEADDEVPQEATEITDADLGSLVADAVDVS